MKKKSSFLISALSLFLVLALTACGNTTIEKAGETDDSQESTTDTTTETTTETTDADTDTGDTATKELSIGLSMSFTSLDPANEYEGDAEMILHSVYDTLVASSADDESDITGLVASDWTVSDDGLTYVFELNQGIYFTTGKELVADDVVYSLNRVKGIQGNPSFLLDTVDSIEATGDYEVTIHLNQVNPSLLSILTRATFGIYDSEVAAANGGSSDENDTLSDYLDANPSIGSGPYQITSFDSGSSVILEKYEDSTLKTGNVDKVIIQNMADASSQQMALEAGDIDFALDLTADQTALLEGEEGIQLVTSKTDDIFFLMLNASDEYGEELANPLVREAISYAIDYEGICLLAGNDAFTPASIIPEGFTGYIGETEITRDVDKAKELLAEAGYPDGFSFDCGVIPDMNIDGVSFSTIAQKIQSDLAEAGIDMQIESQEVSVYLEGYRNGTSQAVVGEWGPDYFDSNNQLAFLPGNTVGLRAGWEAEDNETLVELGEQAAVETDDEARADLFEQIQEEMIASNPPFIVLLQAGRTWAVSDRVENIVPSTAFWLDFAALDVTE